jgi:hypothetical protein
MTSAGEDGIGELEIGQEDVHLRGVAGDHGGELVAGGIEEEGDFDAFVAQAGAEGLDVRPEVVGGDEVQVVDAQLDQAEREAVEFLGGNAWPFPCALEICQFWQKKQWQAQPEKKMAPEPRVPLKQGSSPMCGPQEAMRSAAVSPQTPGAPARRSVAHWRGQRRQGV